jgi:GT2 family glycosyltransferase
MATEAVATVVVTCRDRWSLAASTLDHLLSRTDGRHPVVVVEAKAPKPVAAHFARLEAAGRIRVARRDRHVPGNEARNIGIDGARTEWIAIVENDCLMSEGWLERLLAVAESRDAASAFPAYLTDGPAGPIVHGVGADLEIDGPPGNERVLELHHDLDRRWFEVAREIGPMERVQSEPHALLVRRSLLDEIGGFDEGLWSWLDHVDLALHHRRLGAASWLVPDATCTYLEPPPIARSDLAMFLLRWSEKWLLRSLDHLCATWGLDRTDPVWAYHGAYRTLVRRRSLAPFSKVAGLVDRMVVPAEQLDVWRADRARERDTSAPAHAG